MVSTCLLYCRLLTSRLLDTLSAILSTKILNYDMSKKLLPPVPSAEVSRRLSDESTRGGVDHNPDLLGEQEDDESPVHENGSIELQVGRARPNTETGTAKTEIKQETAKRCLPLRKVGEFVWTRKLKRWTFVFFLLSVVATSITQVWGLIYQHDGVLVSSEQVQFAQENRDLSGQVAASNFLEQCRALLVGSFTYRAFDR